MREKNLTQEKLADLAIVSRQAVGKWLKGTVPNQTALFRISQRTGISPDWLLSGEGQMTRESILSSKHSGVFVVDDVISALRDSSALLDPLVQEYETLIAESDERLFRTKKKLKDLTTLWRRRVAQIHSQAVGVEDLKKELRHSGNPVEQAAMRIPNLSELLDNVRAATVGVGAKKALAKKIGVSPQQLSDWLSGAYAPSGDNALRLLEWVRATEALNKISRSRANDPGTVIQRSSSTHEKTNVRSKKSSHKGRKRTTKKG